MINTFSSHDILLERALQCSQKIMTIVAIWLCTSHAKCYFIKQEKSLFEGQYNPRTKNAIINPFTITLQDLRRRKTQSNKTTVKYCKMF